MSEQKEEDEELGCFTSFVLLSEANWDSDRYVNDLKEEWNIDMTPENETDPLVKPFDDGFIAVIFIPAPIPYGEAEEYAKTNYMWPEAESVAESHKAHLIIVVTSKNGNLIEKAKIMTKLTDACLKQKNAVAVYSDEAVYEPHFYHTNAQKLRNDELPVRDWVWFGICNNDGVVGLYTYGLRKFGKEEIEVYADSPLDDIMDFVLSTADYILSYDVTLKDGETIGYSEEQKLPITLNKGIALDGNTLKIAYHD